MMKSPEAEQSWQPLWAQHKPLMLDIGAGTRPRRDGPWTHIDIVPYPHIELVGDAQQIVEQLENGSVAAINASQFLEHIQNPLIVPTLTLWWDKLENGGWLEVEVPNLAILMTEFLTTQVMSTKEAVLAEIYALPTDLHPHRWGMDAAMLTHYLAEAGYHTPLIMPTDSVRKLRLRAHKGEIADG